jgi:hypothetical protein
MGFRDPCQFHNHGRQDLPAVMRRETGVSGQTECPFRGVECFPNKSAEGNQEDSGAKQKMSRREGREKREKKKRQLFEESRPDEALPEANPEPAYDELAPEPKLT